MKLFREHDAPCRFLAFQFWRQPGMAMDEVIQWTDKYGSMIVILYSLRGQFWPIPILKSGHRTWDSWKV